jgi:nucleoside-diphosphate-sugar epimerase
MADNAAASDSEKKLPHCLLTGANGYLGKHIKQKLLANGWRVSEMTRHELKVSGAVQYRLGEMVNPRQLRGYDALVHCAYDFSKLGWPEIYETNVAGSERLLNAAHEAGITRIVFISTISAFKGCRSLYGKGKLQVEGIAHTLGGWVVRPGLAYGDHPGGMFGRLVASVQRSRIVVVPGTGMQRLYLAHVADIAEAVLKCIGSEKQPNGIPVTVAHERPWTLRAILEAIARDLRTQIIIAPVPWRLLLVGLYIAEFFKIPLGIRSDSLISLIHQNPSPVLNAFEALGVKCKPFHPS